MGVLATLANKGGSRVLWLGLVVSILLLVGFRRPQQYTVVFEGHPAKKVETSPDSVVESLMSPEESEDYLARVVVDQDGNYFWASREMRPMVRIDLGGSYVTYWSNAGYIRTYTDTALEILRLAEAEVARTGVDSPVEYEYVEHIYIYFTGINYYGKRTK